MRKNQGTWVRADYRLTPRITSISMWTARLASFIGPPRDIFSSGAYCCPPPSQAYEQFLNLRADANPPDPLAVNARRRISLH
jgi:hypothetical protein